MFGKLKEAFAKFKKDVEEEEKPVQREEHVEEKKSLKERIAAKFHKEDKPEEGKVYALTGGPGTRCIANGNTWKDSEVKDD